MLELLHDDLVACHVSGDGARGLVGAWATRHPDGRIAVLAWNGTLDQFTTVLAVFGRYLLRKLPADGEKLPYEVQQAIDMASYGVRRTSSGGIELGRGKAELSPMAPKDVLAPTVEQLEPLSAIIHELNERFGTDLTEADTLTVAQLVEGLATNEALASSVQVNTPENARLTFEHVVQDLLQGTIDSNFKFYKRIADDRSFAEFFIGRLFDQYLRSRPKVG